MTILNDNAIKDSPLDKITPLPKYLPITANTIIQKTIQNHPYKKLTFTIPNLILRKVGIVAPVIYN